MAKQESLGLRLYTDVLLTELARKVGYVGFPARELAGRLGELAKRHGARELAAALHEVTTCAGNRVALNPKARKLCWGLLGPPPETWDQYYRHPDGTPRERPPGREKPPDIPAGGPDPVLDALDRLAAPELERRLREARLSAQQGEVGTAAAAASVLLLRGIELPPEEPPPPTTKPKRRARKK